MKKRNTNTIVILSVVLLAIYHLVNLRHLELLKFDFSYVDLRLAFSNGKKIKMASLVNENAPGSIIDYSSYLLHRGVAFVKYRLGERNFGYGGNRRTLQGGVPTETVGVLGTSLRLFGDFEKDARNLITRLNEKGVTVKILPIPARAAIEDRTNAFSVMLPAGKSSEDIYEKLLHAFPVETIDLNPAFRAQFEKNPADPLFASDDHWTSRGVTIAARETCDLIRRESHGFQRVVLAGTSFSDTFRDTHGDLGFLLEQALHVPLVNASYSGAGIYGALDRLKKSAFQWKAGDLLVWEFMVNEAVIRRATTHE